MAKIFALSRHAYVTLCLVVKLHIYYSMYSATVLLSTIVVLRAISASKFLRKMYATNNSGSGSLHIKIKLAGGLVQSMYLFEYEYY
jgi:hypothetical protein